MITDSTDRTKKDGEKKGQLGEEKTGSDCFRILSFGFTQTLFCSYPFLSVSSVLLTVEMLFS